MTNMTRCSMLPLMHSQPQLGALDARDAAGVGLAAAVRGATRARARGPCMVQQCAPPPHGAAGGASPYAHNNMWRRMRGACKT